MRVLACVAALIALATTTPASALDMSCHHVWSANTESADLSKWFPSGRRPILGTSCYSVHLKGKIVVGDADKFAQLLREHHPFLTGVLLTSPGGDVAEAMKVGRMIRRYLIYTGGMTTGSYCVSACFLIWAAGVVRIRSIQKIGLHRPIPTDLVNMAPSQASAAYRRAITEIEAYLQEMEVPPRYSQIMANTASSDVVWLSEKEMDALYDVPSIMEWIAAECGRRPSYSGVYSQDKYFECMKAKVSRAREAVR